MQELSSNIIVSNRRYLVYLLIILLLGFILRIYNLGGESIYYDEAMSILQSNRSLMGVLSATAMDNYPPLHNICLHAWIALFGDSEHAVRSLSVLFGCLTILMTYKVSTLIFDREVGILGALLVSISRFHIEFSQEARMYSLMTLLVLLSIYFFLLLYKKNTLLTYFGYIIFTTLLLYTHIYAAFIILAENIYVVTMLVSQRHKCSVSVKKWFLLQFIVIALFIPWLGVLANRIAAVEKGFWLPNPGLTEVVGTLLTISGDRIAFLLSIFLIPLSFFKWQKTGGRLSLNNLFGSLESHSWTLQLINVKENYFLLLWFFVPIAVPIMISRISEPIYRTRYVIGASLAFYILVASGITKLTSKKLIKCVIIALIVSVSAINVNRFYNHPIKSNWREAVKIVENSAQPNDLVLLRTWVHEVSYNYYRTRHDLVQRHLRNDFVQRHFGSSISKIMPSKEIKSSSAVLKYKRVWLVTSLLSEDSEIESIKNILDKFYVLVYQRDFKKLKVFLFERTR